MKRVNKRRVHFLSLLEIILLLIIIGVAAVMFAPKYLGIDRDRQISSTQENLNAIRAALKIYRFGEGDYPPSLVTLTKVNESDQSKPYLPKLPPEQISSKMGENKVSFHLDDTGGWYYNEGTDEVRVNIETPLDGSWKGHTGKVPADW